MRIDFLSARRIVRGAAMLVVAAGACLPAAADTAHNKTPVWAPEVYGGYSSSAVSVRFVKGFEIPGNGAAAVGLPALDAVLGRVGVVSIDRAYPLPFGNPDLAAQVGLDRNYIITVPVAPTRPRSLSS